MTRTMLLSILFLTTFSCINNVKRKPLNSSILSTDGITAENMSVRIHIIADDSMRGRANGSEGLEKTARYIANEFQRFGIGPGVNDTSFFQSFTIIFDSGKEIEAVNVIGVLRGGDPTLRNEYVVFSAHIDHEGIGQPIDGDSIYNGADDNASGTAAVIEIAEELSRIKPSPKRSIIFLLVSGEEIGLLGSSWFIENPTVPIESIIANLNIDMIGRNWPDTIIAIGKTRSTLGAVVDSVARLHPELGLTVIDDRWPDERFYYRSDHYNFAKKGIPILFFFNGLHEDYHKPSDETAKINFDKTARVARLVALTGLAIANDKNK